MIETQGLKILPDGRRHLAGQVSGIIFGPVDSRRFGKSLGINVFPSEDKVCSFDCLYCECGRTNHLTAERDRSLDWPSLDRIVGDLKTFLASASAEEVAVLDSLTFAGNGEPTLHPDFADILVAVLGVRDEAAPDADVVVLTNGSQLHHEDIDRVLPLADKVCFKLDGIDAQQWDTLNRPVSSIHFDELVETLSSYPGPIIQTMFVRGTVDNTTDECQQEWAKILNRIRPMQWDIYSLDRTPVSSGLEAVTAEEMRSIGEKLRTEIFCPIFVCGQPI